MLMGMVKTGIVGPVSSKIDSYRVSSIIFDLLRVVYSFAGGKKSLKFPTFDKFAPEADIEAVLARSEVKAKDEPMSAEEVMRRLDNWSDQYGTAE